MTDGLRQPPVSPSSGHSVDDLVRWLTGYCPTPALLDHTEPGKHDQAAADEQQPIARPAERRQHDPAGVEHHAKDQKRHKGSLLSLLHHDCLAAGAWSS